METSIPNMDFMNFPEEKHVIRQTHRFGSASQARHPNREPTAPKALHRNAWARKHENED
jgi:hypothetical protein